MPGTGKKFNVSLVTPDGAAFEGEAEMIIVPGAIGEIGVLARHAPLVATLKAGSTRIHPGGAADGLEDASGPGFFEVLDDRAIALVDAADAATVSAGSATGCDAGQRPATEYAMWLLWSGLSRLVPFQQFGNCTCSCRFVYCEQRGIPLERAALWGSRGA